jgi:hypothetical protein
MMCHGEVDGAAEDRGAFFVPVCHPAFVVGEEVVGEKKSVGEEPERRT